MFIQVPSSLFKYKINTSAHVKHLIYIKCKINLFVREKLEQVNGNLVKVTKISATENLTEHGVYILNSVTGPLKSVLFYTIYLCVKTKSTSSIQTMNKELCICIFYFALLSECLCSFNVFSFSPWEIASLNICTELKFSNVSCPYILSEVGQTAGWLRSDKPYWPAPWFYHKILYF